MGCFNSKPKKEKSKETEPLKTGAPQQNQKKQESKPAQQPSGTPSNKPAEGTHVPKPKGDKPVIKDLGNGKKEVVSGDKSILLDEIYNKHYGKVDKKREEVEAAKQEWLKAKDANDPSRNDKAERFNALKAELEKVKEQATRDAFAEVQIYVTEDDMIDLHGLQIDGAIMMMKEELEKRRKAGKKILRIQCGMGHHNTVGYSKIKEEVVKQLKEMGVSFTEDKDHGFVNANL